MKKILKVVFAIVVVLFLYGLGKGIYDTNSGRSSLLSISLTYNSMNPISAISYKLVMQNNSEVQRRIQNIKNN
jgi:hypothetical protein